MTHDEDPIHLVEELAAADGDFRTALIANPRQAIEMGFGVELPAGWTAEVVENPDGSVRVIRG